MGGGGCCGGGGCGSGASEASMPEADEGGCGSGCGCHGAGGADGAPAVHVFSRQAAREVDQIAVEEFGLPSIVLMENAARGVAGAVLEAMSGMDQGRGHGVLVVCGSGNNGGDGLAVARHLHNAGLPVGIVLVAEGDILPGDAAVNLRVVERMRITLERAGGRAESVGAAVDRVIASVGEPVVVIDALLGTGLSRPPAGAEAGAIDLMNRLRHKGALLVAVDVPSGLDADAGHPLAGAAGQAGPCVKADMTVALAGLKQGFLAAPASEYLGELLVVDIGVPFELIERLGVPMVFDR